MFCAKLCQERRAGDPDFLTNTTVVNPLSSVPETSADGCVKHGLTKGVFAYIFLEFELDLQSLHWNTAALAHSQEVVSRRTVAAVLRPLLSKPTAPAGSVSRMALCRQRSYRLEFSSHEALHTSSHPNGSKCLSFLLMGS